MKKILVAVILLLALTLPAFASFDTTGPPVKTFELSEVGFIYVKGNMLAKFDSAGRVTWIDCADVADLMHSDAFDATALAKAIQFDLSGPIAIWINPLKRQFESVMDGRTYLSNTDLNMEWQAFVMSQMADGPTPFPYKGELAWIVRSLGYRTVGNLNVKGIPPGISTMDCTTGRCDCSPACDPGRVCDCKTFNGIDGCAAPRRLCSTDDPAGRKQTVIIRE